jgi:hypothetical protein
MHTVTLPRVVGLLCFYAALFVVIRMNKPAVERDERKTLLVIGGGWAVCVFVANYLLFRAGVMSFLPWLNNFLHTFVWIGVCLSYLYLGVRETQPLPIQIVAFATFSLIVKYAEHMLLGTWELDHFFHMFRGTFAYILGWSLADGLYPLITLYGLRLVSRWVPGLIVQ